MMASARGVELVLVLPLSSSVLLSPMVITPVSQCDSNSPNVYAVRPRHRVAGDHVLADRGQLQTHNSAAVGARLVLVGR
jgi:hypothetical protein